MRIILLLAAGFLMLAVAAVGQDSMTQPLKTVESLNLDRYQGKWYEIAKYPNKFQKKCTGNTTATYKLRPNGRVEVINRCDTGEGKTITATGEAKVVEGSNNTKLKVRFAPAFLSFLPMVWGNYWVIDLDPDYKYAVVGDPDRDYFWILSRTPKIDDATYESILQRAKMKGFEPAKVQKTPQS
jgi:apolipoprotein D and lipocalin family protein